MRPRFKRLQGMWTRTTRSSGENTKGAGEIKKGVWIWREMQRAVKQKDVDFKTTYVIC